MVVLIGRTHSVDSNANNSKSKAVTMYSIHRATERFWIGTTLAARFSSDCKRWHEHGYRRENFIGGSSTRWEALCHQTCDLYWNAYCIFQHDPRNEKSNVRNGTHFISNKIFRAENGFIIILIWDLGTQETTYTSMKITTSSKLRPNIPRLW